MEEIKHMTRPSTSMDFQRVAFVESLHNSLRKQASEAIEDHQKFVTLASSYVKDGLEEYECVELLMIDGLAREAAESYTAMAVSEEEDIEEDLPEYTFQFEDSYGKIWSSYDVGKTIHASSDEDAWQKAESMLTEEASVEFQKMLSINRIG